MVMVVVVVVVVMMVVVMLVVVVTLIYLCARTVTHASNSKQYMAAIRTGNLLGRVQRCETLSLK